MAVAVASWHLEGATFYELYSAKNLEAYTNYYYQFNVCNSNNTSPVGRTKTTPNADDDVTKVGLAIYSCSNYPFGFFNAYGNPVRKDSVDYVVHLGDYIYEYKNGDYGWGQSIGRVPQPDKEIFSLYDYRKRLATYPTDLDLVASHQQFSWKSVWDDHVGAGGLRLHMDGDPQQHHLWSFEIDGYGEMSSRSQD
ncbi:hypothetical protein SLS60_011473 [Paraconiothyrium brasiliense]|uniref:PhoD-like phosphatase metallophosphatase domain-containing protein n=1 Tax=Paraconiothyrium brasiliense TaxID=300254 RepID=A0ABR3QKF0_9PLEO